MGGWRQAAQAQRQTRARQAADVETAERAYQTLLGSVALSVWRERVVDARAARERRTKALIFAGRSLLRRGFHGWRSVVAQERWEAEGLAIARAHYARRVKTAALSGLRRQVEEG